ncbi:MAG: choice-of-anchor Q domain-containing protein, partial [Chloroflexota bacterium]
ADYGGDTPFHLPDEISPALEKIPTGTNGCESTFVSDQRGNERSLGSGCDIGSIETTGQLPALLSLVQGINLSSLSNVEPGTDVEYTIVVANFGEVTADGILIYDVIPTEILTPTYTYETVSGTTVTLQANTAAVWTIDGLAGSTQARIIVSGQLDPTAYSKTVTNTARLAFEDDDLSQTVVFSTEEDLIDPFFPPLPLNEPPDGGEVNDAKPTFGWKTAFDQESGIVSYTLKVTGTLSAESSLSGANTVVNYNFVTTDTSYTPSTDLPNGSYEWTVQAHDAVGNVIQVPQTFTFELEALEKIYLPMIRR